MITFAGGAFLLAALALTSGALHDFDDERLPPATDTDSDADILIAPAGWAPPDLQADLEQWAHAWAMDRSPGPQELGWRYSTHDPQRSSNRCMARSALHQDGEIDPTLRVQRHQERTYSIGSIGIISCLECGAPSSELPRRCASATLQRQ